MFNAWNPKRFPLECHPVRLCNARCTNIDVVSCLFNLPLHRTRSGMRCGSVYSHGCCNVGHKSRSRRISSARMCLYTASVSHLANSSDLSSSLGSSTISVFRMVYSMLHRHSCTRAATIPRGSHHSVTCRGASGRQRASAVDGLRLYSLPCNRCSTSRDVA